MGPSDVFERYAETVALWAERLGGPGIDVEDVVQEVFVRVYLKLDHLRTETKLRAWLLSITRNEIHRRRRGKAFRRLVGLDDCAEQIEAVGATPLEDLQRCQDLQRLDRALDTLSEKHRTALVLFELEQRSGEEVAEMMEIKIGTLWVWLHRARKALAKALAAEEDASHAGTP